MTKPEQRCPEEPKSGSLRDRLAPGGLSLLLFTWSVSPLLQKWFQASPDSMKGGYPIATKLHLFNSSDQPGQRTTASLDPKSKLLGESDLFSLGQLAGGQGAVHRFRYCSFCGQTNAASLKGRLWAG